jgi:hypothetical protein
MTTIPEPIIMSWFRFNCIAEPTHTAPLAAQHSDRGCNADIHVSRRLTSSFRQRVAVVLAFAVLGAFGAPVSAVADERPMSSEELRQLYLRNSWVWGDDGSGYFGENRRFRAAAGSGRNRSWMDGRWSADDRGVVCFSGRWKTKRNRKGRFDKTCFEHRVQGQKIFQRRLPKGAWYVFRDFPPRPTDQKLSVGERPTAR